MGFTFLLLNKGPRFSPTNSFGPSFIGAEILQPVDWPSRGKVLGAWKCLLVMYQYLGFMFPIVLTHRNMSRYDLESRYV